MSDIRFLFYVKLIISDTVDASWFLITQQIESSILLCVRNIRLVCI